MWEFFFSIKGSRPTKAQYPINLSHLVKLLCKSLNLLYQVKLLLTWRLHCIPRIWWPGITNSFLHFLCSGSFKTSELRKCSRSDPSKRRKDIVTMWTSCLGMLPSLVWVLEHPICKWKLSWSTTLTLFLCPSVWQSFFFFCKCEASNSFLPGQWLGHVFRQ